MGKIKTRKKEGGKSINKKKGKTNYINERRTKE
jgi:hypothetical protein